MRIEKLYELLNVEEFKMKLIYHLSSYDKFCFLDGNDFPDKYSSFDYIAAFDSKIEYKQTKNPFEGLKQFSKKYNDWMFGYFSYDLKNDIEDLPTGSLGKMSCIFKSCISTNFF